MNKKILILGDSHSVIWEGNDATKSSLFSRFRNVHSAHLGPALAFNLLNDDFSELGKWGIQVFSNVEKFIKKFDKASLAGIMLCFGEIDIRTQVIKRAVAAEKPIDWAISEVVTKLHEFAVMLYNKYEIDVFVWEPVATSCTKEFEFNPIYPTIGSEYERNYATLSFSKLSRKIAFQKRKQGLRIYSFGIAGKLMNFYETNPAFFEDGCHLNFKGLHLAINSLKELCALEKINHIGSLFEDFGFISETSKFRNVAPMAKLALSSTFSHPNLLSRTDRGWCFHTNIETNPYALIDIGYGSLVRKIIIYNRFDMCQDRAINMEISAGISLNKLIKIAYIDKFWGHDEMPIIIDISHLFGPVRFVILQLKTETYFHLGEIQILENSYLI